MVKDKDIHLGDILMLASLSCASSDGFKEVVFSTSSLTPTMASLPSLKLTWALPLVRGSTPVSALRDLKSVEERESERIGGIEENEE